MTSFTGGGWIASSTITVEGANGPIKVLLVDTEGFSGVGGVTSRTYEANLFGIIYLMSSAVIFNTMFPIDASTARMMGSHCARAVRMLKGVYSSTSPMRGGHTLKGLKDNDLTLTLTLTLCSKASKTTMCGRSARLQPLQPSKHGHLRRRVARKPIKCISSRCQRGGRCAELGSGSGAD